MSLVIAEAIVAVSEAYVLAGVAFALMFLPRGVIRIDPRVATAPKTLRLLILPGIVALWPLLAWRWIAGTHEPLEENPHRAKARSRAADERPRGLAR